MSRSSIIREYRAEDGDGVLALFRKHFGAWSAERSAQRWQWQYAGERGCTGCTSFIQVVEADGAIVGYLGAFPLPLRIGAERLEVLSPGGLVVEPKHGLAPFGLIKNLLARNKIILGIGWSQAASKLFRFNGAVSLPASEVRYVYPLRHVGATHRELRGRLPASLRWLGNRWTAALAAPLLDRRRGRSSKPLLHHTDTADLRTISRFGDEYDSLWQSASRQFEVSLDKDSAYMNWRYIDCPTSSHLCLGCYDREGQLAGVAVACRRAHSDVTRKPCGTDGEIVELIAEDLDGPVVKQLVTEVMARLGRMGVDAISALGFHAPIHRMLEEIGFERTSCGWATLFAAGNEADHPASAWLRDDICYFTCGDGDHLFLPAV